MKKIIIASKNPVKVNATLGGFQKMFPNEQFEIESVSVPSLVSDQPKSDAETFSGACNRADNAYREYPKANFWVGIEGGLEKKTLIWRPLPGLLYGREVVVLERLEQAPFSYRRKLPS